MAIQCTYTSQDAGIIPKAYIKIHSFKGDKQKVTLYIHVYLSPDDRQKNANPIECAAIELPYNDSESVLAYAYNLLKQLNPFSIDVTDC